MRRRLTASEIAVIRAQYGTRPAGEIAREIGRPVYTVWNAARRFGLGQVHPIRRISPDWVRARHAEGWTDREMARAMGCEHHTLGIIRRRMGLPTNTHSARRRDQVRQKTNEQLRAAGLSSLGALRAKILRERSAQAGWPADLPWRAGQILTLLWENGPMTRQQIVEAIRPDLVGKCTLKTMNRALADNDVMNGGRRQNSYLATLMRLGLVVSLGRIVGGRGQGRNVCMYSLPLTLERQPLKGGGHG